MFPEPAVLRAEDLKPGLSAAFERDITEEDIFIFARNSGDANPLHVDEAYALSTNYSGRIVHGAFQVGLASALIGMHLPGRNVLLGSVNAKFPAPLYYPTRVRVTGQIISWNASAATGSLRVTVQDTRSQVPTAEIHIGFALHEQRRERERAGLSDSTDVRPASDLPVVFVTGASGGLGTELIREIAAGYRVVGLSRSGSLAVEHPNVQSIQSDLQSSDWESALEAMLGDQPLYGIVHMAWPGQPHGSLLQSEPDTIDQQISFGASKTVALARFLFSHCGPSGGRFIALSSIVGSVKPVLPLATYSLGKATLENTITLLAPELARKKITANAISPSFVATGMNKQANDRQRMKETALVPMGRLCEPSDVTGLIRYLLSPEAAFVSGQVIALAGGQL